MYLGPAHTRISAAAPLLNHCYKASQPSLPGRDTQFSSAGVHRAPLCRAKQQSSSALLHPNPCVRDLTQHRCAEAELPASVGGGEGSTSASPPPPKLQGGSHLWGIPRSQRYAPGTGWRKSHTSHPQARRQARSQWSHAEVRSTALWEQLEGDLEENQAAPAGGAGGATGIVGSRFQSTPSGGEAGAAGRPPDRVWVHR